MPARRPGDGGVWSAAPVSSLLSILGLGFVLGMRHATDPDHVVAVTTLVTRERGLRSAAVLGSVWGVGHTATLLVVGGAMVLFRLVVPPRLGLAMEFAVAVMLVGLGVVNLLGVGDPKQASAESSPPVSRLRPARLLRSLAVGIVHGLAGSAAVALLVLTTIQDPRWAVLYLLVFGVGTIAGMMLVTSVMVAPLEAAAQRSAAWPRRIARVTGVVSLAFGLFLAFRIGVTDGLFSAHPVWKPE